MLDMFSRSWSLAAGLAAVLGLVSLARAGGVVGGALVLVCPDTVVAGQPIDGYVVGFMPPVNVTGDIGNNSLPGSPTTGLSSPFLFSFPTTESMAGSLATVCASDSKPESASHTVAII